MKSLLIRAEDKNLWERRSPLVPADLQEINQDHQFTCFIEKSGKRYFSATSFEKAGAQSCEGMEQGDVILGVKEIPIEKILNNKIYLYFSHTIKGQQENMPMLQKIIDSGSTLIDYEKIADDKGLRKVFFGPYAGDAGAIDIMWLLGEHWQNAGIDTPFMHIKQALNYDSVKDAKEKLRLLAEQVSNDGFPKNVGPVVIGILGYGNVSKGAQQIFQCLPHEYIEPEKLEGFLNSGNAQNNKLYISVFKEEHLVEHVPCAAFQLQDYYKNPENFRSRFSQFLPYLTILVNATYWEYRYPKFVTWDDLEKLFRKESNPKLCAIADITCDVNGSVECNVKSTNSGMPAYRILPLERKTEDGHKGDGIVFLAVDNLPAELPKDASEFFSTHLKPFIPGLLNADFSKALNASNLLPEIQRAVIVYNGQLTKEFLYLKEYLS